MSKNKNHGTVKGNWHGTHDQLQNLNKLAEYKPELTPMQVAEVLNPPTITPVDYSQVEARVFNALFELHTKLYEQIDLLEKGKIGTWQAAFEIVREIRKLKGEPAK